MGYQLRLNSCLQLLQQVSRSVDLHSCRHFSRRSDAVEEGFTRHTARQDRHRLLIKSCISDMAFQSSTYQDKCSLSFTSHASFSARPNASLEASMPSTSLLIRSSVSAVIVLSCLLLVAEIRILWVYSNAESCSWLTQKMLHSATCNVRPEGKKRFAPTLSSTTDATSTLNRDLIQGMLQVATLRASIRLGRSLRAAPKLRSGKLQVFGHFQVPFVHLTGSCNKFDPLDISVVTPFSRSATPGCTAVKAQWHTQHCSSFGAPAVMFKPLGLGD